MKHAARATLWRALLVACALLALNGVARAQQPEGLRILLLEGPTPDWVRRVRGQLSDLPVAISTLALVVEGQPEAELARQLVPLAEHRDAALVAWLRTAGVEPPGARRGIDPGSGARTEVAIWFARSGRFFARRLGGPWRELSGSDRSGALELAALSVRSAVRSLLLDPTQSRPFEAAESTSRAETEYGVGNTASSADARSTGGVAPGSAASAPPSGAAQSPPPAPAPVATQPAAAQRALSADGAGASVAASERPPATAARAPEEGPIVVPAGTALVATDPPSADQRSAEEGAAARWLRELRWNAELGLAGHMPGPPAYASAGLQAGLRARSDAWGVLLLGQLGLPLRSELGPSEVKLQQHALLAELQYLGFHAGAFELGPLLRGGVRFARRESVGTDPAFSASAAKWHEGLRLGLGATAEARWGTQFGASLRGVLHWEPARMIYAVRTTEDELVSSAAAWALQPSLEIAGSWFW